MTSTTVTPCPDAFYYLAGLGFLALAKAKHLMQGYRTPKPISITDTDACIAYDVQGAERYLSRLEAYGAGITGKRVLELGPGSDLGLGLSLVQHGAAGYVAFDRFPLAGEAPPELYRRVPALWRGYVFSEPDHIATRLLPPRHGDSSGVRGAAWLWPA